MTDVGGWILDRNAWFDAIKKAREIQDQYGVTIDPALILSVPDPFLIIIGQSKQLFAASRADRFIARPVKIAVRGGRVLVKYPNGATASVPLRGETPTERVKYAVKIAQNYHYVELQGGRYIVKEILEMKADTEAARQIVEVYGKKRALAMALGLTAEALDKYWWRAIPLITRAHAMELSAPGTGKTSYGYFLSRVIGGIVVNEPPTPTFLAGDARDGSFGVAFTSSVIVFDETDKWSRKADQLKQSFDILLSGMENCTWVRGAGKGVSYSKCLSTAWLGNQPLGFEGKERDKIVEVLSKVFKINVKPLLDRISYIAVEAPRFSVGYVGEGILKPTAIRGIAKLMTETANTWWEAYREEWDVRSAWHLAVLRAVNEWLERDAADDELIMLYKGGS